MFLKSIALGAIFCCALATGSVSYRLHNAKPILRPQFAELRFSETWVQRQRHSCRNYHHAL
jgi:hypothetical protein